MQVKCLHGYFMLHEQSPGEISRFMSIFEGLVLVARDGYYTFDELSTAPDYAIGGSEYLGAPTSVSVEGNPWDVMRANDLVYNFNLGKVVPIATVTDVLSISQTGFYFFSPGLIMPGSMRSDGTRVTDYAGFYSFDAAKFRYSEVL